ncbi:MAG: 50S ribosomal protein L21 [Helicobacteraceae bacterium]
MYAIIKAGGKQYKVSEGDVILFDKMSKNPKDKLEFTEVLFLGDEKKSKVGAPLVSGAKVSGEVINEGRGAKVVIFKKRRRKDSKQKRGFRRDFTRVKITKIEG